MQYRKKIVEILRNRDTSLPQKIDQIKHNVNSGQFKEALSLHSLFKNFLHKTPYFNSIEDIHLKEPFNFSQNLKIEFRWLTNILEDYFTEINEFMKLKNNFETLLLLDNYDEARLIVLEIEDKFGISLWSIEAHLFVEDNINGTEANWNLLSDYLTKIKTPLYEFIINSSSKRVESKMSFESFLNHFQNDIDTINADGVIEDFLVFKNFNYPNYDYSYKNLESVYYVANTLSIVDQYLILIDAIIYNSNKINKHDRFYQVFLKKAKKNIHNDSRLINLYNLLNIKDDYDTANDNELFFNCSNSYYEGLFKKTLKFSLEGLKENPLEFEYYEFYCKSLINLESDFIKTGISRAIDKILFSVFQVFSFKNDEQENFDFLLTTALRYMNTSFGKQVFSLISEIEANLEKHYIRGLFSSSYTTSKFLFFHNTRECIIKNLAPVRNNFSFQVAEYKLGLTTNLKEPISKDYRQNKTFKAIRYYNKKEYPEVIELLENDPKLDSINYYRERKISLLFHSYLHQNLLSKALKLYGLVFFDENFSSRKINTSLLFNKIKECKNKQGFEAHIEFPIVMSLHSKEFDLYEAYDDFLFANNIEDLKNLDIDSFVHHFGLSKTIYFLENVSTIDTIKYSSDYGSISEVEEDRVMILNILIKLNNDSKTEYEKEINEILRTNSVRKVLKEVDEGRLYIDVDNLKKKQIKKFKDDFKRFKEIEQSSSAQKLISFNPSNKQNWDELLSISSSKIDSYNSAEYLAFKNIYLESRENFLFSKEHGLDSCLSTRIRHGALKNHIRSVFEKLNLVTSKLNNEYKDNDVWEQQLSGYFVENIRVQKALKKFSSEIDEYIIFIVDKLIQIKTEKTKEKDYGIFGFFTNDDILYDFFQRNREKFDTTETIIDMLLTNLVEHTLISLQKKIVNKFKGDIRTNFQEIIDNCIEEVREFNLTSDCELIPNLIKSGTEIQKELEVISDWFYLNTTNSTSLLSIDTVIEASIVLTNRINPNFLIKPTIQNNIAPFGVYSSTIFVFNILLNNIISHSKLTPNEVKIHISIDLHLDKYVKIAFCNNLKENEDYSENRKRLEEVKQNWNDHSNIDRSNKEDKSGFDKIKRILIYETSAKTDMFDFSFSENNLTVELFFPFVKLNEDE
ncbi:hypothetical protein [Corallibacter sp.]|uniref:hypothetical protein n=1 Tax=Corallibacter sp. TaxID=2038084 RepID=UPI003AB3F51A